MKLTHYKKPGALQKRLASAMKFIQSKSVSLSLDELAEQIAMLGRELPLTGRLLYGVLEKAMLALRGGRAPRTLGLAEPIAEGEGLRQAIAEITSEAQTASAALAKYVGDFGDPALAQQQRLLERELAFWKDFSDRAQNFLKRLALLADQDKPSPLGLRPLNDAWEEIERVAQNR